MKTKRTILLLLSVLTALTVLGQHLTIRSYIEKTSVSLKTGTALVIENDYQWEYGAFYQESSLAQKVFMSPDQISNLPRVYEKNFGGLFFAAPVVQGKSYNVKLNVRAGLGNGEWFIITPSVLANYELFNRINVSAGLGARAFRPTMQAGISMKLHQ
ncbi:MAG: hypothetical protein ACI8QD_002930 [Cyclobacteriaceae bacterium]|jgi:hypothetical protein